MATRSEIRRVQLGTPPGGSPAQHSAGKSKPGLCAIAIAPASILDRATLLVDGNSAQAIHVGVGCPWIGYFSEEKVLVAAAAMGASQQAQLSSFAYPGNPAAIQYQNGRPISVLDFLSADLEFFYGQVPPVLPVRRAPSWGHSDPDVPITTGTYYFPVHGRTRLTISMHLAGGTSIDYVISGVDAAGKTAGTVTSSALASGTLTSADALFSYEGVPFDFVQVALSNPVASGVAQIAVNGYDP